MRLGGGGSGPAVGGKCFNLALPLAGSDTSQVTFMCFQPPVSGGFASERFGLLRSRENCSTAKEKVPPGARLQACSETYEEPRACA